MTKSSAKARALGWKLAASVLALSMGAGFANEAAAQNAPTGSWDEPQVVPRDGLATGTPPPAGIYDQGITGIGNVITSPNPATGGVGVCTGTLINPRTVIFAAHCVNDLPANAYGSAQGGEALSVGFNDINLTAIINWINNGFATNTSLNIYNANQVWYDPRSLDVCNVSGCFFEADIALATLDTPAFGIPTWTLLFSPLTEATHVTMVGYGNTGSGTNGANIALNFRRRAAENMLDSLASIDDRNTFLFGAPSGLPQTVYSMDFDDPLGTSPFDFDIYDGAALPREGMTAGGDSGGPLIVDQMFDRPVVAGTLSGGSRFFGAQPPSGYGTTSFYQPLFLYWDVIVQNNPYVYASARAGIGNWFDPNHWVQDMDPNYAVIRNGALANDLPDTPALGNSTNTTKFGGTCFLDDCAPTVQSGPGENSTGPGLILPGGPGSTNFVPNNVDPDILTGVRAHYYDVTLDRIGLTYLRNTATIDRFTMDGGLTALDVRSGGTLNVLGDFTVGRGLLNVDGRINSGETLLVQALLTGAGTFNPTFLTSVDGIIAPGGLFSTGTLTVQGDVILASGNELLIQLGRTRHDQLRVTADPAQGTTGAISLGGDVWFTPASGAAPRHGQSFTFVLADGAATETFDGINGFLGILRPKVTYTANSAVVELKAGSFADLFLHAPALMPFALALDEIREDHYASLYGLYGEIDLMDGANLARAFSSFAPSSLLDARGLMSMQDAGFATTLQNRLSLIARSEEGPIGLSISGSPADVLAFGGDQGLGAASDLAFASSLTQSRNVMELPNGMTGFFSGGYDEERASAVSGRAALTSDEAMRTWNMAGGVEQNFGAFTLGIAAAYANGHALQTGTGASAENSLAQSAIYGVYSFENGAYLSGLVGAGSSTTSTERRFIAGTLSYHMQGDTSGEMMIAAIEGGVNFDLMDGLTLTPRIGIEQMSARVDGFTEAGGETALAFEDQLYDRFEAKAGVSLAGDFAFESGWRFAPTVDAMLVANLAGNENGVWARFAAVPDAPFYLPGALRDEFWGEVAMGFALTRDETSIGFQLESSIDRDELYEDRAVARFAHRF